MVDPGEPVGDTVPSPRERRRRNREQMVVSILEAARAVMRERGVADLSLREVARRVSMQAPSLYEYFPSKLALYDALFQAGFRRFGPYIEADVLSGTTFWDFLRCHFEGYLRFAVENPELYQLLFEHPVPGFAPTPETMAEMVPLLERYTKHIADAIATGEIAPGVSASRARDLTIAMMHGITSQHLANDRDAPPGGGRYGDLIGPALALFRASWSPAVLPPLAGTSDSQSETPTRPGSASGTEGR